MRRIRAVAVGISLAAAAPAGLAQDAIRPTPTIPAASIGRIQIVDAPVTRAQATDPMKVPAPGSQPLTPGAPPPAGNLQMPRPLPQGPGVTELRGPPGTGYPVPAATFGVPAYAGAPIAYGGPMPVGPPVAVGPPIALGPPVMAPSVFPAEPVAVAAPAGGGALFPALHGLFAGPYGTLAGPNKLQVQADFLLWYLRGGQYPPLVTTSAPSSLGIIGQPTTQVLYGSEPFSNTVHAGAKFGAVYWFGDQKKWALDGSLFFLARRSTEFATNTSEHPLIARPFNNVNQGIPYSEVVGSPGLAAGAISVHPETSMWGAELNARRYLASTPCLRVDLIAGYRYMVFNEEISITEAFARTPNSPLSIGVPNALFGTVSDKFRTENSFNGGQVGFTGEFRRGRWYTEWRASIALGVVHQSLQVAGVQNIQFDSGPGTIAGGLLALPGANLGTFEQNRVAFLPEVGFKVGYHLTPRWRVAVGYNFMYLSSVLRAGDNIDPNLDVTRIPNFPIPGAIPAVGGVRPAVNLKESGIFAQGISFSVQFSF